MNWYNDIDRVHEAENAAEEYLETSIEDGNDKEELIRAYLDGVKYSDEHPNWISVKKRIPEQEFYLDENGHKKKSYLSRYVLATDGKYIYKTAYDYMFGYWLIENTTLTTIKITHWMELPILPKKHNET